ncbi:MAG TPA: hypothetical protein VFG87_20300 [Amycolatopsis sp.]|jgi:hypothetical protein|nr:hypothetical protein [Amycolatopsis sp.]
MKLKKVFAGIGLAGALIVGTLGLTVGSAAAAQNELIRTYWTGDWGTAQSSCQSDSDRDNANDSSNGFYYCAQGGSQVFPSGQTLYSYNLWLQQN